MPRKKVYETEEEKKEGRIKSINKWQKINTTTFTIRLFNSSDVDVIKKIRSVDNKTDYIRKLILEDIKKEGN